MNNKPVDIWAEMKAVIRALPQYREGHHARIMEEQKEQNPYLQGLAIPIWDIGWEEANAELIAMSKSEDEFPTHPFVEGNDN